MKVYGWRDKIANYSEGKLEICVCERERNGEKRERE